MKWLKSDDPSVDLYCDDSGRIVGFAGSSDAIPDNKVRFVPYMAFHERRHIGDFLSLGHAMDAIEKAEELIKKVDKAFRVATLPTGKIGGDGGMLQ